MAFVQIGSFALDIQTQGANEQTRGDRRAQTEGVSTYGGGMRRQGLARKREWSFLGAPLAQDDYDDLITEAYGAAYRLITGDAMPAGGVNCIVTIEGAAYVEDEGDALGFKRVPQITLRER